LRAYVTPVSVPRDIPVLRAKVENMVEAARTL